MIYSKVGISVRQTGLLFHEIRRNLSVSKSKALQLTLRFDRAHLSKLSHFNSCNIRKKLSFKSLRTSSLDFSNDKQNDTNLTKIGKDQIDYSEFEHYRLNRKALIVDVRTPEELKQNGEIPNTINIPLAHIPVIFSVNSAEFEDEYGVPKPGENDPIIVFCKMGVRSEMAKKLLTNTPTGIPYKNVANYPGSFDEWSQLSS